MKTNLIKSISVLLLGLGLSVVSALSLRAGEAAVSVKASAQDPSVNLSGNQSFSTPASFQPTASATALYGAGLASAYVSIDASTFTGQIHADFQAAVGDNRFVVGRGANASGAASMTGSITLSDGYPPGIATFSAILEGAYNFSNATQNFNNRISLNFSASIGDTGERNGSLTFDPFSIAGLFAIPMTWTQEVHGGQKIDMSFFLSASVDGLVDRVELNALNTFKLTSIALPAGYTYASDAQGFLSEFGAPVTPPTEPPVVTPPVLNPSAVPEPSTYAGVGGLALAALMIKRKVRRR